MAKNKIIKGDTVKVIAGADKGKTGKVLSVDTKNSRVVVEGVNVRKRHTRPSQQNPQGGVVSKSAGIHISNVMHVDSKGKATRVAIKFEDKKGKKVRVRVAKTTGEAIAPSSK